MSIDSYFWVPAGIRNLNPADRRYLEYKCNELQEFEATQGISPHQVFWCAGGVIDEQYFFEDADNASWFYREGWKLRNLVIDGHPMTDGGPTGLWIDDVRVDQPPVAPTVEAASENTAPINTEPNHRN